MRDEYVTDNPDAGNRVSEDQAGISALAELIAARPETTPELSVPLSSLTARPQHQPADGEDGRSALKPRVLLVEDDPVNRLLVGVLLDRLGLEHVAVGCGEEAIFRFAREPFDAILLDITMDGSGGLATARALHALSGGNMPPLVALGGSELPEEILQAAGVSAVADAPLDTNRIALALITAIEMSHDDTLPV